MNKWDQIAKLQELINDTKPFWKERDSTVFMHLTLLPRISKCINC